MGGWVGGRRGPKEPWRGVSAEGERRMFVVVVVGVMGGGLLGLRSWFGCFLVDSGGMSSSGVELVLVLVLVLSSGGLGSPRSFLSRSEIEGDWVVEAGEGISISSGEECRGIGPFRAICVTLKVEQRRAYSVSSCAGCAMARRVGQG